MTLSDALVACAEAFDGLGWRIHTVQSGRIVAHANGAEHPAVVEVILREAGESTSLRIVGSNDEPDRDGLIAQLDRACDAIEASVEDAEETPGPEVEPEPQVRPTARLTPGAMPPPAPRTDLGERKRRGRPPRLSRRRRAG